jgi:hypothetical protein
MSRGRASGTVQLPMMRAAGPADHNAVRERDRLLEIMGDEHHRLAVKAPQVEQQVAHDLPGLRVERAERLVHQQDLRVADQHLHQADALALPTGQHVRIAFAEVGQAHAGEPVLRAPACLVAAYAGSLEPDRNILERGLPWKQRVGLEKIAGLAVEPGEPRTENVDLARRRRDQPGGNIEQGRFAAAGRADNGNELTIGDRERGALDRRIAAAVRKPEGDGRLRQRNRRRSRAHTRACVPLCQVNC